jgi:hypothetical protein
MPWRSSKQDGLEIIDPRVQGTNRLHLASLQDTAKLGVEYKRFRRYPDTTYFITKEMASFVYAGRR